MTNQLENRMQPPVKLVSLSLTRKASGTSQFTRRVFSAAKLAQAPHPENSGRLGSRTCGGFVRWMSNPD